MLGCFHRLIARMRSTRFSSLSASAARLVARYSAAIFSRLSTTLGWFGPSAFSQIARERLLSGSASACRPLGLVDQGLVVQAGGHARMIRSERFFQDCAGALGE